MKLCRQLFFIYCMFVGEALCYVTPGIMVGEMAVPAILQVDCQTIPNIFNQILIALCSMT